MFIIPEEHKHKNITGIIPLNLSNNINKSFYDEFLPIGENYTIFDHALKTCLTFGCETIWVICPEYFPKIIKDFVGDFVGDHLNVSYSKYGTRTIPIFYMVSYEKSEKNKILNAIELSSNISKSISEWVEPHAYFITFPMGVHRIDNMEALGIKNSFKSHSFYLAYQNAHYLNELKIGFKISKYDAFFAKKCNTFEHINFKFGANVSWYHYIDSFESYVELISKRKLEATKFDHGKYVLKKMKEIQYGRFCHIQDKRIKDMAYNRFEQIIKESGQ